jgi:anaerobic magnesium-protoporphyrin IX monomethyl ester cyclase
MVVEMPRVVFFNPPSRDSVYRQTNVRVGTPSYPNLAIATLAAHLIKDHQVRVVDLDFAANPWQSLSEAITSFRPDVAASSVRTPVYEVTTQLMRRVKEDYPTIKTVVGGVHITAMPDEAAGEGVFDTIVLGEADTVLMALLSGALPAGTVAVPPRPLLPDLDSLPFPAWQLFDLQKYKNSRLSSRENPVGHIETSRGCSYHCNFCSKLTFGTAYRVKSPIRVVDEMEYMLACGFREIHIADDSFTQDIDRAKSICEEILRRGLRFPWSLINGVRVNLVDAEFFRLARRAGLWQVGFGIESGSQRVLDRINKRISLSQVREAVNNAAKAGVDTFGFFIFGLSGETRQTMDETIRFAKSLPLSTAKFDICIPYPGTRYYQELMQAGAILDRDWSAYVVHQIDKPLYRHENLDWPTIGQYYARAYREYYLRPRFIWRRFWHDLKSGDLPYDAWYFLRSKWW